MDLNNVMTLEPHQLTEPRIMWLQLQLQKGGGNATSRPSNAKQRLGGSPGWQLV